VNHAATGRVHRLLAVQLPGGVRGIPGRNDEFLCIARSEGPGDVECEGVITTAMAAEFAAVQVHRGLPVHSAEPKQDAIASPAVRHRERAAVPESLLGIERLHHARERRLDGERDQDSSIPCARRGASRAVTA
jgi:hypothetical protein